MKRTFYVRAVWDKEARVFYSESDISGLHIEAPTIEAFEQIMGEYAVELIMTNHITPAELASTPIKELVPAILWQRPEAVTA